MKRPPGLPGMGLTQFPAPLSSWLRAAWEVWPQHQAQMWRWWGGWWGGEGSRGYQLGALVGSLPTVGGPCGPFPWPPDAGFGNREEQD